MALFERLPFRTKLALLLLIPLLGMMVLGVFGSLEKRQLMIKMERMSQFSRLGVSISNLVHELQKERGASAGLLGSKGKSFRSKLTEQRKITDQKWAELQKLAVGVAELNYSNSEIAKLYKSAVIHLDATKTVRDRIDALEITSKEALDHYTLVDKAFLHTIDYLSSLSATVEIASLTGTYVNFLKGKERAGVERAVLTDTFARNGFGPGMYRWFSALVSEQETFFAVNKLMASPEQRAFFAEKMAHPAIAEVERMRSLAFKSGYASTLYVHLGKLYQNMALRGAYHSIKNLIIRGSWYGYKEYQPWQEKQLHYKAQFEQNFQAIKAIIDKIFALSPTELSPSQRKDVQIVWRNIQDYHNSVDVIIELQNQGKHLHEIDYDKARGVKINDNLADLAIRRLIKSTSVGEYGIDPQYWFKTITEKINLLKEVENNFADTLIKRSDELYRSSRSQFFGYLAFIIANLAISIIFGLLILRQLKNQTDQILAYNKQIALGDLSVRIPVQRGDSPDALNQISVSMNMMVDSLEQATNASKKAMHDLKINEFKIRSVLETAPDVIIAMDADGFIESINPAGENLFGYYPETLPGTHISKIIPSFQAAGNIEWHNNLLKSGKISNVQLERDGVCFDQGSFPLEISMSGYTDAGNEQRFTLIVKDITERKQAKMALEHAYNSLERRVRERTAELQLANEKMFVEIDERVRAEQGLKLASKVFENANEGILITDATVNIIRVNKAFTNITGFKSAELLGKNPQVLASGRHDAEFFANLWDSLQTSGEWSGEIWNRRKDGQIFPQLLSITTVWNQDNQLTNYVGIFSDITQIKETEERLEKMAYFDALTDLPNRVLFRDRLAHELSQAERKKNNLAVLFIDLDRFKHVNDSLGHTAGDTLLVEVAERLTGCLRKSDTVARLGGDEFAAITTELKSGRDAAPLAKKIIKELKKMFIIQGQDVFIGGSIGISIYPSDGTDMETLTKHADIAMYRAKEDGRGVFKFFEENINAGVEDRLHMESKLRKAIEKKEFSLFYQPKVNIESGMICGMESLVRWFPEPGKMVSPALFIPLAEETGAILPLGDWILRTACQQAAVWRNMGHDLQLAVNLSTVQLQQKELVDQVKAILDETGLTPEALELEITESMVMGNVEKSIDIMKSLKGLGVGIAVDDFGTGYSSLNYLKRFPIDTLKIDQSFVRDLTTDAGDSAIVSAIISLGQALNLKVVAEGVESRDHLDILRDKLCQEIQGYYFSKPLPTDQFEKLLKGGKTLSDIV